MGTGLLPSPQLFSSPMLPSSQGKYDYFKQVHIEPEKKGHFSDRKREWQDDGRFSSLRVSCCVLCVFVFGVRKWIWMLLKRY